jgi:hypothetical protein
MVCEWGFPTGAKANIPRSASRMPRRRRPSGGTIDPLSRRSASLDWPPSVRILGVLLGRTVGAPMEVSACRLSLLLEGCFQRPKENGWQGWCQGREVLPVRGTRRRGLPNPAIFQDESSEPFSEGRTRALGLLKGIGCFWIRGRYSSGFTRWVPEAVPDLDTPEEDPVGKGVEP